MNKTILIASVLAFALGVSSPGHSCDDGYAIEAVLDDGNVIKLDDGSLWEVDSGDAVTAEVRRDIAELHWQIAALRVLLQLALGCSG